jgi:hypothetical protein
MAKKFQLSVKMDMALFHLQNDLLDLEEKVEDGMQKREIQDELLKIASKLSDLQNDGGNVIEERAD